MRGFKIIGLSFVSFVDHNEEYTLNFTGSATSCSGIFALPLRLSGYTTCTKAVTIVNVF